MKLEGLTSIVPVSQMAGKLSRLESWIESSKKFSFNVILVHDVQDAYTGPELKTMVTGLSNDRVSLIEGFFGSPGGARNAGLKQAASDFVVFWDADDLPNLNSTSELLLDINNEYDLLIGQYEIFDDLTSNKLAMCSQDLNINQICLNPGLWRMIFRRSLLVNLEFENMLMGEDQVFLAKVLCLRPKMYIDNKSVYSYFKNVSGQLTGNRKAVMNLRETIKISLEIFIKAPKEMSIPIAIMDLRKITTLFKYSKLEGLLAFGNYLQTLICFWNIHKIKSLFQASIFILRSKANRP